jgi:hypothetical protein
MSRVISFRDLRIIPELSQYNEIELLHPSNDKMVAKYLEVLGFNTNAPVQYIPNKHRDVQGNVGVGFRAVGTIAVESEFLKSHMATMEDRIMATFFKDPSLARELAQMLNTGISFVDVDDVLPEDEQEEFPEEHIEPDYEEVSAELKTLEVLRDSIRGPMMNESGAPKTYGEYVYADA